MRNDRVLIPVLHVAHDTKYFHLVYTRIFIDNYRQLYFITIMQTVGLFEYKEEGSVCGFNRKGGLAETDS